MRVCAIRCELMPDVRVYELEDHRPDRIAVRDVAMVLIPVLILFSFFGYLVFAENDFEREQRAFMSKCIEFHSESRCLELNKWGRRDLFDRRDGK